MDLDNELIKLSKEINIRKYSPKTKKAYLFHISKFLLYFAKNPNLISKNEIKEYLNIKSKNYNENTLRLLYSALKFFYINVLENKSIMDSIPKAKQKQSIPKALTKKEINIIIENIKNEKHKLIISTIYSGGLRLSEIINLKRENLNPENNSIRINNSKQKKDRITICSKKLMKQLTNYICKTEFKTKYLFETNKNKKYSPKSIQLILIKASKQLNKRVNPHMLMHSFATHLLEFGIDIHYIQNLLGHNSIKTTQSYLKIATNKIQDIKNPLDYG